MKRFFTQHGYTNFYNNDRNFHLLQYMRRMFPIEPNSLLSSNVCRTGFISCNIHCFLRGRIRAMLH